jgi:O-antigen/teichoic acid export membrane protein
MKEQIAKSVFWMVWSRGGIQFLSFVSTLVVARLLSPSDYGLMALAGIWTGTIAMLAEMGLGAAIIQFRDVDERELNACFWLTLSVTSLGYCALYAAAPSIAAWFGSPRLSQVLRIAGLSLPLMAVRLVPDALLRKELKLDKIARAEILSATVIIPVMLGLAWSGAGVWALVTGTLLQALAQDAVIIWFQPWKPGLRIGSTRLREIIRYSGATLGARLGWALYAQMDTVILGKLAGEQVLGFYSIAKQLAILPVTKISVVVNEIASPVMAQLQADPGLLSRSFLRVLRLVACLTVPLCFGMALVSDDLIRVLLAEKWIPVIPLFQVFCAFALMHSFEVLLPPVLLARYRAAFLFWWTVSLLLVMPIAFWLGAMWLGALGVALAQLAVYPFLMLPMIREAFGELRLTWRAVVKQVLPVTGPAAMMVVAVVSVLWALPDSDVVDRMIRLTVGSGVGAVAYGFGVFWRGGGIVNEIREVTGWLFGRGRVLTPVK